jgi:hypothetical protein
MVLNALAKANRMLLTGCILVAPYLSIEGKVEDVTRQWNSSCVQLEELEGKMTHMGRREKKEVLFHQLVRAFESYTIDLHDEALAFYWTPTPINPPGILPSIPYDDILDIAFLLTQLDPNVQPSYILELLIDNLTSAKNYINAVAGSCLAPNDINERASQWIQSSVEIANYLNLVTSSYSAEAEELRLLFVGWTRAQITDINNIAPLCMNPTVPVDASAASGAYTQSRTFAYFIAREVFELLSSRGNR